jgi:hypothetical protein
MDDTSPNQPWSPDQPWYRHVSWGWTLLAVGLALVAGWVKFAGVLAIALGAFALFCEWSDRLDRKMKTRFCAVTVAGKDGPEAYFFDFETAKVKLLGHGVTNINLWEVRRQDNGWECRSTGEVRRMLRTEEPVGPGAWEPLPAPMLEPVETAFQRFLREYPRLMLKSSVLVRSAS